MGGIASQNKKVYLFLPPTLTESVTGKFVLENKAFAPPKYVYKQVLPPLGITSSYVGAQNGPKHFNSIEFNCLCCISIRFIIEIDD